jgi:hypothetical protein
MCPVIIMGLFMANNNKNNNNNNMASENGLHNTITVIHNGYYSEQITRKLKLLNLHAALYILMHKAVIFNTCRIIKVFGTAVNKKRLVSATCTLSESAELL